MIKSIWSVNNTLFSLKALTIVSILVGLGTYVIVFNIDNLVGFSSRIYSRHKLKLVEQMKNHPDKRWSEHGKRFGIFRPKQERIKPTEWMIALFILHKMFPKFRWRRSRTKSRHQERGQHDRKTTHDVQPYAEMPDLAFLGETVPSTTADQNSAIGTSEPRKESSIRQGFARLSMVFRRGALSSGTSVGV
jgi:hypothetical protein